MEEIIQAVDREKIIAELTEDKLIRKSHFGSNHLYTINHLNAPNTMLEIGRLREIAFRVAGGGTGKSTDIDSYDTHPIHPYQQLIVWDPEEQEILGGYRYIFCKDARTETGSYNLATNVLFKFSKKFEDDYLPYVVELGRSFVHHDYQSGNRGRKGIFVLDNLWEGLGAIIKMNPFIKYLFGKVTMYLHYDKTARDYILYFMLKNFGDKEGLMKAHEALTFHGNTEDYSNIFTGNTVDEDYKILFQKVREHKVNIPPLINSYVNLSKTMKSFETVLNTGFGDVEETGILVTVEEIVEDKKQRYIDSYNPELKK